MKDKVLIVMTTTLALNGISSMVVNFFQNFKQTEFEYDFAVWNDVEESLKQTILSNNGHIHQLPHRKKEPVRYFNALKKLIQDEQYKVVHAHGNSSTLYIEMLAAKQAGVAVRISHSHNSNCEHKILHYALMPSFRRSFTRAYACSDKAGDWLYGKGYEVIKNGIDLETYTFNLETRKKMRKELDVEDKKVIGHVANYDPAKNHSFLLEMFSEIVKQDKNVVLLLIGDGDNRNEIYEKIQAFDISDQVKVLGKRSDIPKLLQAMDAFVLPSIHEGLPFVLIEAQAAGLPCFVSDQVSEEAALTELVSFIPIHQGTAPWIEQMDYFLPIERKRHADTAYNDLYLAGYSLQEEAIRLEDSYARLLKEGSVKLVGGI